MIRNEAGIMCDSATYRSGREACSGGRRRRMVSSRVLLVGALLAVPVACAKAPDRYAAPPRQVQAGPQPGAPVALSPADFSRQAAPSLWGVIARGPGGEEVRGSAVAVSPRHLLTTCGLVTDRDRVGLSHLEQY